MSLVSKIPIMHNHEINGLAKNRFIDEGLQVAIAKFPYRVAREHLANNPMLCEEAREILWSHRGYALKCALIATGHYNNQPDKYRELWNNHKKRFLGASHRYRITGTFLKNWWPRDVAVPGYRCTPADVLEDIYINQMDLWP